MAIEQAYCESTCAAQDLQEDCSCFQEEDEESHLFRAVMIAVPAGLMLWAGVLRIAVVIAHRL